MGAGRADLAEEATREEGRVTLTSHCRKKSHKMRLVKTDPKWGILYQCPCGWQGWSKFGGVRKHARECAKAR